ncbi:hypothetical protein SAY86_025723 [Trapa natans]|uniref:Uncharacterized protein n=1 Tax=Trapa natans TaxID=22666 RepID=A0AAN7KHC4_TRANT|nr:hypothetical protein SAY86_025723 [Trapa natans]
MAPKLRKQNPLNLSPSTGPAGPIIITDNSGSPRTLLSLQLPWPSIEDSRSGSFQD